jgi:hypothetical protein
LGESLPKVVWYLTTKNGSAPFYEMKGILFRSVLARIGFHYLGGKMYGGISSILLTQQRNFFQALFEMSNSGQSGFWIKITTAQKSD